MVFSGVIIHVHARALHVEVPTPSINLGHGSFPPAGSAQAKPGASIPLSRAVPGAAQPTSALWIARARHGNLGRFLVRLLSGILFEIGQDALKVGPLINVADFGDIELYRRRVFQVSAGLGNRLRWWDNGVRREFGLLGRIA